MEITANNIKPLGPEGDYISLTFSSQELCVVVTALEKHPRGRSMYEQLRSALSGRGYGAYDITKANENFKG